MMDDIWYLSLQPAEFVYYLYGLKKHSEWQRWKLFHKKFKRENKVPDLSSFISFLTIKVNDRDEF